MNLAAASILVVASLLQPISPAWYRPPDQSGWTSIPYPPGVIGEDPQMAVWRDPQCYPPGYTSLQHAIEFPGFDPIRLRYSPTAYAAAREKWNRYNDRGSLSTGIEIGFTDPPVSPQFAPQP